MKDDSQYTEFKELFLSYVTGDCHAITYDDEVVYNSYSKKTIKETIQEDMIRSMIIEDPHGSLLVNLFRNEKRARIILYMFGHTPWFLACYYDSQMQMITVEQYKSQGFIDRFD